MNHILEFKKRLNNIPDNAYISDLDRDIITSYIDNRTPLKSLDFDRMMLYIRIFDLLTNKDDANKLLMDICDRTTDLSQINTFKRIIKNKPKMETVETMDFAVCTKKCPHCDGVNNIDANSDYAICGYTSKGFDWKGCGNDWCPRCEKKLCKNWEMDQLFNPNNRTHDGKCCLSHATVNGVDHIDGYCNCSR